jgi:methionine biosynthesis protein MetW
MRVLLAIAREFARFPRAVFGYQPLKLSQMDYEHYWKVRAKPVHQPPPRISVICDLVEKGSTVLDLGCGDGELIAALVAKRNVVADGVDISREALLLAEARGLINLEQANLSSPAFKINSEYDYIILTEVLEHIPNPEDLLAKARGHFRKGLIVSVPNVGYYTHRIRLLLGRFPLQWTLHPGEHLRFWTVCDFSWWVKLQGYRVTKVVPPPQGFPILYRLWPSLFADQVVFVLDIAGQEQGKA